MATLIKPFAAIELNADEPLLRAVERFMNAANELGIRFNVLELYGALSLGSYRFVRFRTDAAPLDQIAQHLGKGAVLPKPDGTYEFNTGNRKGRVPSTTMQESVARPVKYRGTKDKFWQRQFVVVESPRRGTL